MTRAELAPWPPLMFVNGAFGSFVAAVQSLSDASLSLLKAVPIFERLTPILEEQPETDESKAAPGKLRGEISVSRLRRFTTTSDLRKFLREASSGDSHAVFHAAAVSDFRFGKLWRRTEDGQLREVRAGKLSTRHGSLIAELVPTEKLIAELRGWFPRAQLVGWKYEVDGGRARLLKLARRQIVQCRTDACVANGPAYGLGFGFVEADGKPLHLRTRQALFKTLGALLTQPGGGGVAG